MKKELPKHTLRISKRAQRPNLRIREDIGLELVLPQGYNQKSIPELLEHFRPWIEKHYPRIMGQKNLPVPAEKKAFPLGFFIKGGHSFISFNSQKPDRDFLEKEAQKQKIICPRLVDLQSLKLPSWHREKKTLKTYAWLRNWVKKEASRLFTPKAQELSQEYGFAPEKISYRLQRTRWGSCSGKGNLSFNAALLFLPRDLSRYILIHELCHLRVMNHSELFWKEVFAIEPRAMEYDKAMRRAGNYLPWWLK